MRSFKLLITPKEAARLAGEAPCTIALYAQKIAEAYVAAHPAVSNCPAFLYGCVFNAGRIQGRREERARKKVAEAEKRFGVKAEGVIRVGGKTLPVFKAKC